MRSCLRSDCLRSIDEHSQLTFVLALGAQMPAHQSKRETSPEIEWDSTGGELEGRLYKTGNHKEYVEEEKPQKEGVYLWVA